MPYSMYNCVLTLLKIGNVTQSSIKLLLPFNTLVDTFEDSQLADTQSILLLIKLHVELDGCLLNWIY
jgi:hypothetical protein